MSIYPIKSILLKVTSNFMFKSKGKTTLKLRCYDFTKILNHIVNFSLILSFYLWSWTQETEMDFWIFIKIWSLMQNTQISKLCGRWSSLPLLKTHLTRKGSTCLHTGSCVLGQLEIILCGYLNGDEFFLMDGWVQRFIERIIGWCMRKGNHIFFEFPREVKVNNQTLNYSVSAEF